MPTVADVTAWLDRFAPPRLAAEWDNTGLIVGDPSVEVRKIMMCLTVTPDSAGEAVEAGAQLIVSHHPMMFRPIKTITTTKTEGAMLWNLARAGVAVYSPHTAFDNTRGGINDAIADGLGLTGVRPLRPQPAVEECKIVVFVPESDLAAVSDALFAAGAGIIGEYRECSYRVAGVGTFFGSEDTNPTIGQKGRREEAPELRLEVVCPLSKKSQAVAAMCAAHSYEEPAYDVYMLHSRPGSDGEGRIGELPAAITLRAVARSAKKSLNAVRVQIVGDLDRPVQTIAVACGAAGEFFRDAVRCKADVFLTGEMRFHDYLAAESAGVALVLPGHYATERPAVEMLAQKLHDAWDGVTCWASESEHDPVQFV